MGNTLGIQATSDENDFKSQNKEVIRYCRIS